MNHLFLYSQKTNLFLFWKLYPYLLQIHKTCLISQHHLGYKRVSKYFPYLLKNIIVDVAYLDILTRPKISLHQIDLL